MIAFIAATTSLILIAFHLMAPAAYAAGQQATSSPPGHARPSNIPADYIATPFGIYVARDCVIYSRDPSPSGQASAYQKRATAHELPQKDSLPPCYKPRYNRNGTLVDNSQSLSDLAQGNYDLQLSYPRQENWSNTEILSDLRRQAQSTPALPSNKSDQTIFLTTGMIGDTNGYVIFLGYNFGDARDIWSTGVAIANINGNVFVKRYAEGRDVDPTDVYSYVSHTDSGIPSQGFEYFAISIPSLYMGPAYRTPDVFTKLNAASVITFGVTSCDMLPPAVPMTGVLQAKNNSRAYPGLPDNFTNGLCGLKADVSDDNVANYPYYTDFKLNYYNEPPKTRSAIITYETN